MKKRTSAVFLTMIFLMVSSAFAPIMMDTGNINQNMTAASIDYEDDEWIKINTPEELSRVGSGGPYPADGQYVLNNDIDFTGNDLNGGFDMRVSVYRPSENEVSVHLYFKDTMLCVASDETMAISLNGNSKSIDPGDYTTTFTFDTSDTQLNISGGGVASNAPDDPTDSKFAFSVKFDLMSVGTYETKEVNSNGNMYPLSSTDSFTGKLHGDGHSIIGLNTAAFNHSTNVFAGLFANVNSVHEDAFYDLHLVGGSAVAVSVRGNVFAGGLIAGASGPVTVTDSHNGSDVTVLSLSWSINFLYAGGLIGSASFAATVINSWNEGNISSSSFIYQPANRNSFSNAGGLVGHASSLIITDSHNEGRVTVSTATDTDVNMFAFAGGLNANTEGDSVITGSHNIGDVTASLKKGGFEPNTRSYAGGLTGRVVGHGTVTDSYNTGNVTVTSESSPSTTPGPSVESSAGGFFGTVIDMTVTDSYNTGNVTSQISTALSAFPSYAGGLAGLVGGFSAGVMMKITGSYNSGDVSSVSTSDSASSYEGSYMGGLVGRILGDDNGQTVTVDRSYNTGRLVANTSSPRPVSSYVGGLVGHTSIGLTITDGYNEGIISSYSSSPAESSYAGGLVACSQGDVTLRDSHNTGNVTSSSSYDSYAGGLVGRSQGDVTITNSYNRALVVSESTDAGSYAGGLVARSHGDVTITQSYSEGTVSSEGTTSDVELYAGGLIGYSEGDATVTDSYKIGDVTSTGVYLVSYAGGLIGYVEGMVTVTNIYIEGEISGDTCGAVLGCSQDDGINYITNAYFLKTDTINPSLTLYGSINTTRMFVDGSTDSVRTEKPSGGYEATVLRTEGAYYDGVTQIGGMKFPGWDFSSIWGIEEIRSTPEETYNHGYPYLFTTIVNIMPEVIYANHPAGYEFTVVMPANPSGYQWQRLTDDGWADIEGATSSAYVTTDDDDLGRAIRCVVTIEQNGKAMTVSSKNVYVYAVHIDVVVGEGGKLVYGDKEIAGSGTIDDIVESSLELIIVPYEGYKLGSVTLDGVDVTSTVVDWKLTVGTTYCRELEVTFIPTGTTYMITSSVNGDGGTIDPDGDTEVTETHDLTLTIHLDAGYVIARIVINGTTVVDPAFEYTFRNIISNNTIEVFIEGKYTVTASSGTGGTVTPSEQKVADGGDAQIVIHPDEGYVISAITVDGISVPDSEIKELFIIRSVNADMDVSVTFTPIYTITAVAGKGGSIDPEGDVKVTKGRSAVFNITADEEYSIFDVLVDGVSKGPQSSFTFDDVNAGHSIRALFAPIEHDITFNVAETGGTATISEERATALETVIITVDPSAGYAAEVSSSVGVLVKTGNFRYALSGINEDCTVTVTFTFINYNVTLKIVGSNGTAVLSADKATILDTLTLTVGPDAGYAAGISTSAGVLVKTGDYTCTLLGVDANCTVTVTFTLKDYNVILKIVGSNGTAVLSADKATILDTVTLTVNPDAGYGAGISLSAGVLEKTGDYTCTISEIDANCTVTVTFVLIEYNITLDIVGDGGTAVLSADKATVRDTVTLTVNPDAGYVAEISSSTGVLERTGDYTCTLSEIGEDCTVTVTFTLKDYKVILKTSDRGGTATTSEDKVTIEDTVTVTVSPDDEYTVKVTSSSGVLEKTGDLTYTISKIDANCTVTVAFEPIRYNITLRTSEKGGTASVSSNKASITDTVIITVSPDDEYDVDVTSSVGVLVKTGDRTYALTDIGSDSMITVRFISHDSPGGGGNDNTALLVVFGIMVGVGVVGLVYLLVLRPRR